MLGKGAWPQCLSGSGNRRFSEGGVAYVPVHGTGMHVVFGKTSKEASVFLYPSMGGMVYFPAQSSKFWSKNINLNRTLDISEIMTGF